MHASQSNQILVPLQQNYQQRDPSYRFGGSSFSSETSSSSSSRFSKVAFFVEVPFRHTSPVLQKIGTKRKRPGATGLSQRAARGRAEVAAPRNRDVPEPHATRHRKPSSSRSNGSEWSSVGSASPSGSATGSGAGYLRDDADLGRGSSRSSLHRGMNDMSLTDKPSSEGSSSVDLHFRRSNGWTKSGAANLPPRSAMEASDEDKPRNHRNRSRSRSRSRSHFEDRSDEEGASPNEDEDKRLLETAPTWQLSRLKKGELVRLNRLAGTWRPDEAVDPDLYTKIELVNAIIVCRSRSEKNLASFSESSQRRRGSSSQPDSPKNAKRREEAARVPSPTSPSRRLTRQSSASRRSQNDVDAADGVGSETDVANEGGGEETEAEHFTTSRRRAVKRHNLEATRRAKGKGSDKREDSSGCSSPALGRVRKLRNRTLRLPSGKASAEAARALFGGSRNEREGDNSYNSPVRLSASSPIHRTGSRMSFFMASSPIRTRSRSRNQASGGLTRRIPVNRSIVAFQDNLSDQARTPRPRKRGRSGKIVAFDRAPQEKMAAEDDAMWIEEENEEGDMRHLSERGRGVRTRSQLASGRGGAGASSSLGADGSEVEGEGEQKYSEREGDESSKTITLSHPSDDEAEVEVMDEDEAQGQRQGLARRPGRQGGSSGACRAGDESRKRATRHTRSNSTAPLLSLSDLEIEEELDNERRGARRKTTPVPDESDEDEEVIPESPSKFRKLRNGKLRLPPTATSEPAFDDQVASPVEKEQLEEEEDIEMESDDPFDPMMKPTSASLSKLRRAELFDLCQRRGIETGEDDKKADLIRALMSWYMTRSSSRESSPPESTSTERVSSSSSTSTAKARSERDSDDRRRGPKTRATASGQDRDALLLSSEGLSVKDTKPPSPPLTSRSETEDILTAVPGDGVDELNGLDLESLNLLDKEIPPSKLEKLEKIGSGGFKDVYVGKYHISKTRVNKVAIADIRNELTEMDIKELSLLRDLRHENIVRFIGVSIPEDPKGGVPCMIVSELCSNGDLFDYIRNVDAPSDIEVFRILLEIARGLEYLHTRSPAITHRDCKSTNVLITKGRTAKINDFGLARVKNSSRSMMRSLVGTVNWQAVELWVPKPHYNEKVDVWSAAMTFWETLQWRMDEKRYPFQGMNEHQIYQDVGQKGHRPRTASIRKQFGNEIVELLESMWQHSPKDRPTMTEVCQQLEALIRAKKEASGIRSSRAR
ncbi:hypothetical protein IE53DRAFT_65534 [Violaceomyces palustris]|uniref:Uncharacterized protein n=1 Tax=Violaceomyces palustris TaxID=1673888 RepID=A0ACD0NZ88_9BASI|nr:hypothetical protein IE53DRAFT_65534 [Violaceomyces palustris]